MSGFLPGLCDLLDKDEIPSKPQAKYVLESLHELLPRTILIWPCIKALSTMMTCHLSLNGQRSRVPMLTTTPMTPCTVGTRHLSKLRTGKIIIHASGEATLILGFITALDKSHRHRMLNYRRVQMTPMMTTTSIITRIMEMRQSSKLRPGKIISDHLFKVILTFGIITAPNRSH